MPSETRVTILECAGNGRVFLVPQVEGAQWELGAVGNAEWTRPQRLVFCFPMSCKIRRLETTFGRHAGIMSGQQWLRTRLTQVSAPCSFPLEDI